MGTVPFQWGEQDSAKKHRRIIPTEMSLWKVFRAVLKALCTVKERIR